MSCHNTNGYHKFATPWAHLSSAFLYRTTVDLSYTRTPFVSSIHSTFPVSNIPDTNRNLGKDWKLTQAQYSLTILASVESRGVGCSLVRNFPNNAFKKCISFKRSQQGNQVLFCGFAGTIAKCCDVFN